MINKFKFTAGPLLVASLLFAPFAAQSASVTLGSTCEAGTCPTASDVPLTIGQSASGNFNFTTIVNGDLYRVSGDYSAAFPGSTSLLFTPTATYIGGGTTAQSDTLTVDLLQSFSFPGATDWDGTYHETVPLVISALAGAGSSASGEAMYDSMGVGLVTQTGPGSTAGGPISKALTGLNGDTLNSDFQYIFTFGAGTTSTAFISSPAPTPEPAQAGLVGFGLLAAAYLARRRSLRNSRIGA
jgi:hypothetical protein